MGFRGAIFDVDGVLVDSPHEKAWREGLRELMEGDWSDIRDQTSWSPEAFTPQVYQSEMSGKPRFKGAQAALEYFGVPDAETRAKEYGDRKQAMIVELIEPKVSGARLEPPIPGRITCSIPSPRTDSTSPMISGSDPSVASGLTSQPRRFAISSGSGPQTVWSPSHIRSTTRSSRSSFREFSTPSA